jgi:metal-responsive CopG/Arc/MetJ family transcriptional regulator
MKTIQMTLDESLLKRVDQFSRARKTTRSGFIRGAIEAELRRDLVQEMEHRHAQGYAQKPVQPGEFDAWSNEQAWGSR